MDERGETKGRYTIPPVYGEWNKLTKTICYTGNELARIIEGMISSEREKTNE